MNIVTKHIVKYCHKGHKLKKLIVLITGVVIFLSFRIAAFAGSSDDMIDMIAQLARLNNVQTYSVTYVENGTFTTINSSDKEQFVFEAASLSKPVVAYICMQLVKESQISLDDTIAQHLSEQWTLGDTRFNNITVRQLLSHTAGFSPSYEIGIDKNIYFEPGKYFSYSGVGYIYLQQVIETITGETLEQLAHQYVFSPLSMQNSTFAASSTVTPFVNTSSLVLYIIVVWSVISIVIFILGLILGLITKFKFFNKNLLFYMSIAIAFISAIVLIAIIIPRMILPALVFGTISFLILWITRKGKRLFCTVFLCFIALCSLLGILLPISLPVGPEIISRKPNAAYSLKSTSEDIAIFANELLAIHYDETSGISQLFEKQTIINEKSSWGLGVAIEETNETTTYWHSGINPGMQSFFVVEPKSKTVVVVMTNSDNGLSFSKDVARNILEVEGLWEIERVDLSQLK